jgi:sugar-specific transcriptional regulator TrmB
MRVISDRLIDSLRMLGLTEYEAKVYSALVLLDVADVKKIYEYWGASKPNVYQSLKSLTDKGLVMVVSAKPALYRAVPYDIALNHLMEAHRRAETSARDEFKVIEKHRQSSEMTDVLWTLFGENNIQNKLEEMLSGARLSVRGFIPPEYYESLAHLSGKDVYVDILLLGEEKDLAQAYDLKQAHIKPMRRMGFGTGAFMQSEDFAELHKIISDDVLLLIIDDKEVIYLLPTNGKVRSGLTSMNPTIVRMGTLVFNTAWRSS